ncbi:peroxide stress protein YaaA, partial [Tenacibaculum discolor]
MLILLSPAKSLDYDTAPTTDKHTLPQFAKEAAALIEVLRPYTP